MIQFLTKQEKPTYEEFYEENFDRVTQYVYQKLNNWQDAEDLAGEVFLYCYSHWDQYDPDKSSPTTWLYMIVNSRLKNRYRDAKHHVALEDVVGVVADEDIDMDACIYLEQLRTMLDTALAYLPERQQKIVRMRYFEDLSGNEIADILGMTPGNVRVQLSRALDTLEKHCTNLL